MYMWMKTFPLTAWWYVGVESLGFLYNVCQDGVLDTANGSILCVLTLLVTSVLVLFACSSTAPVALTASVLSPLDHGISLNFNIPEKYAVILVLPATYATAFG